MPPPGSKGHTEGGAGPQGTTPQGPPTARPPGPPTHTGSARGPPGRSGPAPGCATAGPVSPSGGSGREAAVSLASLSGRLEATGRPGAALAPLQPFAEKLQESECDTMLRGALGWAPEPRRHRRRRTRRRMRVRLPTCSSARTSWRRGHSGSVVTGEGGAEGGTGRTRGAGPHRAPRRCWDHARHSTLARPRTAGRKVEPSCQRGAS